MGAEGLANGATSGRVRELRPFFCALVLFRRVGCCYAEDSQKIESECGARPFRRIQSRKEDSAISSKTPPVPFSISRA